MNSGKARKTTFLSFPWKRESSIFKYFYTRWTPAFAGVTTFFEIIIFYHNNHALAADVS